MKCSKCGTEFQSRFCPNCGTPAFDLPGKDTSTEQVPESTKLVTPKNKWAVLAGTVLFLIVVAVLIVILAQSCSSKKNSSGDETLSQLAGTTTEQSTTAPAAAPQTTTTVTSSTIGANSSQAAAQSTVTQSAESQSQEYVEPASSSNSEANTDNASQSKFQDGMTYQQAKKLIGSDGVQESSVGNTVVYTWEGKGFGGSQLSLTFKDGKLDVNSSYGLEK